MILVIIVAAVYSKTGLNRAIAMSGIIFLAAIVTFITRRQKVPFIEILDGTLTYFDNNKGAMVSIPVGEITHVSSRFCELLLHTADQIHCLNLDLVRSEKSRWEIKDMIRTSIGHLCTLNERLGPNSSPQAAA